jgi:hypothetical protein
MIIITTRMELVPLWHGIGASTLGYSVLGYEMIYLIPTTLLYSSMLGFLACRVLIGMIWHGRRYHSGWYCGQNGRIGRCI